MHMVDCDGYEVHIDGNSVEIIYDDAERSVRYHSAFAALGPRGLYLVDCEPPLAQDTLDELAEAIERAEVENARA